MKWPRRRRRYYLARQEFLVEGMTFDEGAQWLESLAQALAEQTGGTVMRINLGAPDEQEPETPRE